MTIDTGNILLIGSILLFISILAGKAGYRKIAAFLNAQAVITTATDVSHCFAADLFAQKNNYVKRHRPQSAGSR